MSDGRAADFMVVVSGGRIPVRVENGREFRSTALPDDQKRFIRAIEVEDDADAGSRCTLTLRMDLDTSPQIEKWYAPGNQIEVHFEADKAFWQVFDGEVVGVELEYPEKEPGGLVVVALDRSHRLKNDRTEGTLSEGNMVDRLKALLKKLGSVDTIITPQRTGSTYPKLSKLVPTEGQVIQWGKKGAKYRTPWDVLRDVGKAIGANRLFVRGDTLFMVDDDFINKSQSTRFSLVLGSMEEAAAAGSGDNPLAIDQSERAVIRLLSLRLSTDTFNKSGTVSASGFTEIGEKQQYSARVERYMEVTRHRFDEIEQPADATRTVHPRAEASDLTILRLGLHGFWLYVKDVINQLDEEPERISIPTDDQGFATEPADVTAVAPNEIPVSYTEYWNAILPEKSITDDDSSFLKQKETVQARAEVELREALEKVTVGKAKLLGEPRIELFTKHGILLSQHPAVGKIYDGEYTVSNVKHTLNESGYITELRLMRPLFFTDQFEFKG